MVKRLMRYQVSLWVEHPVAWVALEEDSRVMAVFLNSLKAALARAEASVRVVDLTRVEALVRAE